MGVEEESLERQGNANILKLCHFEVYSTCCCGDDDCDCTELRCFRPTKIRPLFETSARRVRPPDKIVKEARRILKKRNLCCHCGVKLVPIGRAREGGRDHDDWSSRFLHKKCWRSIMLHGEVMEGCHETDEES